MLREWTDKLPDQQAAAIWREERLKEALQKLSVIEADLKAGIADNSLLPMGFYEAMQHFITLREKMFPFLPVDPAWNILVTLAGTPAGSARGSMTSIAYGAGVPLTTVLRYVAMMEVEGVVERVDDPTDKRRTIIQLTAEGRDRLDAIATRWKARTAVLMTLVPIAMTWALRAAGIV